MDHHIVFKPHTNTGLTISGTTGTSISNIPTDAIQANIICIGGDVYMRWDDTVPCQTGIDGSFPLLQSTSYTFEREQLSKMIFVPRSAAVWMSVAYMKGE